MPIYPMRNTLPNATSFLSISFILRGGHPFIYPLHYREYTKYEITKILSCIGVEIVYFESHSVFGIDKAVEEAIKQFLTRYNLHITDRGDDWFIIFRKPMNYQKKI